MLKGEGVRNFRVIIDENGTIDVVQDASQSLQKEKIKQDSLRKKTIETLVKILQDGRLKNKDEYQFLGENLYAVLFDNEIGKALIDAIDESTGLIRVELQFEGQDILASWPWEYLFCPKDPNRGITGYFLANHSKLILTRHLRLNIKNPRTLRIEKLPLKVLFVAPSPREDENNNKMDPVQYLRVLEVLEELQQKIIGADSNEKLIKVYKLVEPLESKNPPATWGNFVDYVEEFTPHVIHFIGHGKSTPLEGGAIAFMKKDGTADWVDEERFAEELLSIDSLRMVFLQSCESALPDPYQAISGVAMRLAHINIPAVVGMQYKVKQEVASLFARTFYTSLADKLPVDEAIQKARRETQKVFSDWANLRAFGLPVLYQSEPGALLSEMISKGQPDKGRSDGADNRVNVPKCPWCEIENDIEREICRNCGGDLVCPACKTRVSEKGKRCENSACELPLHIRCPWCDNKLEVRMGNCPNCGAAILCPECSDVITTKRNVCKQGHLLQLPDKKPSI